MKSGLPADVASTVRKDDWPPDAGPTWFRWLRRTLFVAAIVLAVLVLTDHHTWRLMLPLVVLAVVLAVISPAGGGTER